MAERVARAFDARRVLAVSGSLLLLGALGAAASVTATSDFVKVLWPVGIATGAAALAAPRFRLLVAAVAGVVAALTAGLGDLADPVVVGAAAIVTTEVWVASRLLRRSDGRRPELRTDDDLRRYFAACVAAGFVGAGVAALVAVRADTGDVGSFALGVGTAHFVSHLYLVPFFLRLPTQSAIALGGERVLQWATVVVSTPLLLVPDASPPLVFLIIPVLAWGALRLTAIEALVQLAGVVTLAVVLTSNGTGPFADLPVRYDLSQQTRGLLLAAFCASCAVIVVPCCLRVGEYLGAALDSASERDLVRGIVDGATGVAIIGTDEDGRITLFNPGAERMLGYRSKDMIGNHPRVFFTDGALAEKAAELGVDADFVSVFFAMIERRMVDVPVRFRRRDGVERTHAMTITRLSVGGRVTGYVSTSEDITDRLGAEQTLRAALETERRAVERLQEVDAVKDQFVSTVSHELRTPITSIQGYLEMLVDGDLGDVSPQQRDALLRVQSNSRRLLSLIDDLLTLSRVAEDGLRDKEAFDLRASVRTAFDVLAPSWEPPRWLDVTLTVPETTVTAHGNPEMIERLVVNLLSNAVKFTDDGGAVTVSLYVDRATDHAVLRVADTGIGIPQDEQDQLFNRFFRSSLAEKRAIQGSGLGLSISRAIVEHHGGVIQVQSRPGEGTAVDVRIPLSGEQPSVVPPTGMSNIQLPLDEAEPADR